MLDLKFEFSILRGSLEKKLMPFMAIAVIGAILNLIGLIAATLDADQVLRNCEVGWLLFASVGWFLLELIALEILARVQLRATRKQLKLLRLRRAPLFQG